MSSYVDALKRWRLQEPRSLSSLASNGREIDSASHYDRLHERLQIAANNEPLRIVAFAGVSGGEGVGHVVLGYAERLAQGSLNVLVVLADAHILRAPSEIQVLDLVRLVANGSSPSGEGGLQVAGLPARHTGAAQFLASPAFTAWLAAQAPLFDQIVMEVPPALKYSEASVLGKDADGVVLVVRAGHTQIADVAQAQRQLARAGARVFGVVLNHVQAPPSFLRRLLMPELEGGSRSASSA